MVNLLFGLIPFIAVIICVAAISVVKKKKAAKELPPPDDVLLIEKGGKSDKPKRSEKNKSSQIVIYEYQERRLTVNCPHCDGENSTHTAKCSICGENLF